MEALSIQELRQALRERGANCRGSKKQLWQSVAKVRVSIQKSRNEACALLIDPTQSVEHCLQQIIDKAKSKFRIKAKHLYIVNTAAQGGGTELTTDNLRQHLKDGLVVLASPITRLGSQMIVAQQLDHAHASPTIGPEDDGGAAAAAAAAAAGEGGMAQLYLADCGAATASNGAGGSGDGGSSAAGAVHRTTTSASVSHGEQKDLTDSGSCSSELEELDGAEQRSVVSFDSESLYSFTTAAEHPSASAPASQHSHHLHQHHHPQHHQSHARHGGGRGGHHGSFRSSTRSSHASHDDLRSEDGSVASSAATPAAAAALPGIGYTHASHACLQQQQQQQQPIPPKGRGWKWMLPRTGDQQLQQQQQACAQSARSRSPWRPPTHPPSPSLPPQNAHAHRNHRCQLSAPAASAASSSSAAASSAASSSPAPLSGPSVLPSIMQELHVDHPPPPPPAQPPARRMSANGGACACCEAGCEIDFAASSSRSMSPLPQSQMQQQQPLQSGSQASLQLYRSSSLPAASSSSSGSTSASPPDSSPMPGLPLPQAQAQVAGAAPPLLPSSAPSLSLSQSIGALDSLRLAEENRSLRAHLSDVEKRSRRLESSLKSYLKSDVELRAQLAQLSASGAHDPARAAEREEELVALRLAMDQSAKEAAKGAWAYDRLKSKQQQLMERNNSLKADSEALTSLRKEHTQLQQAHARLNGQYIDERTSPAVLQELLVLHATALARVQQQMASNLAAERKELKEKGSCKICMAKPADTILLPCSHFVLCGVCAASVQRCPICRTEARSKLPVYT